MGGEGRDGGGGRRDDGRQEGVDGVQSLKKEGGVVKGREFTTCEVEKKREGRVSERESFFWEGG